MPSSIGCKHMIEQCELEYCVANVELSRIDSHLKMFDMARKFDKMAYLNCSTKELRKN